MLRRARPSERRSDPCGGRGEPSKEDKWIAQLWLHQTAYTPSSMPAGTCQREGDEAARRFAEEHGLHPPPPLGSRV